MGFGIALGSFRFVATSVLLAAIATGAAESQTAASPTSSAESATQTAEEKPADATAQPQAAPPPVEIDIDEYVIEGVELLPQDTVERAVYPHLGPKRTTADVEKARAALEKAYQDRGFQTIAVEIPPQNSENGIVRLRVVEGKINRVAVNGAKFFSPETVRKRASSLREGSVPNFNKVQEDLVALNQWPDRRVTPALRAGVAPGTIDVDLNVEDKFPMHGSVEFNNRQSAATTPYRLNSLIRYDNLWQLGHSFSFTYSVAPERPDDAESASGSYLLRVPDYDFFSMLLYGVVTTSDVTTIGDVNVNGPGEIFGVRGLFTLPARDNLFHSLSVGIDYKNFDEGVRLGGMDASQTPIEYYPISGSYTAVIQGEGWKTELNFGAVGHFRGLGSDVEEFDAKRFDAKGSFFYVEAEIGVTRELAYGAEIYGRAKSQFSESPLVSTEQFSAGGLDTVRGYFESEVLGDSGIAGRLELRSPDIVRWFDAPASAAKGAPPPAASPAPAAAALPPSPEKSLINELRVYAFADAAFIALQDPLPEQQSHFSLASIGVGSRIKFFEYMNGSIDFAVPLTDQSSTQAFNSKILFRIWGEF